MRILADAVDFHQSSTDVAGASMGQASVPASRSGQMAIFTAHGRWRFPQRRKLGMGWAFPVEDS
jgi:hypothetical protein